MLRSPIHTCLRLPVLAALLCSSIACNATKEVGDNCEDEGCVASAETALASCQNSCAAVEQTCPDEAGRCDDDCRSEVDSGGYEVCQAQFDALHACCKKSSDSECEYPGLDECSVRCPMQYLAYRTCTRSDGERTHAHEPGESVAGCIDICAHIQTGCPGDGRALETCIEECLEEEAECVDQLAWLELSTCCASADYRPICAPEQDDLDIKRCRAACPAEWSSCDPDDGQ
jgi:hypothetical protein